MNFQTQNLRTRKKKLFDAERRGRHDLRFASLLRFPNGVWERGKSKNGYTLSGITNATRIIILPHLLSRFVINVVLESKALALGRRFIL